MNFNRILDTEALRQQDLICNFIYRVDKSVNYYTNWYSTSIVSTKTLTFIPVLCKKIVKSSTFMTIDINIQFNRK